MAVTLHLGPYTTIPTSTSPGLHFLKSFMPALDSLETHPMAPFLHPDANIYVGSNPPNKGSQIIPLLNVRRKHLSSIRHDMDRAWDVVPKAEELGEEGHGRGRRTVMFEATSATVFRNDPDEFAVKVKEFNILELEEKSPRELEQGQEGEVQLQIVEMRTYFDAQPVKDRASHLQMSSAYGEAKTIG